MYGIKEFNNQSRFMRKNNNTRIKITLVITIAILVNAYVLTGCFKRSSIPDYNGIDVFAEYVNNNAEIEIIDWDTNDIDNENKIATIGVIVNADPNKEILYSEIDSIRLAGNRFLKNHPEYFLNEYCFCLEVRSLEYEDHGGFAIARFANFEEMILPVSSQGGKQLYDSLCAIEVFMSEDDLDYVSGLHDIVSLRIHPAVQKDDQSLKLSCVAMVSKMSCLNDVYVVGSWYDCFMDSDLECSVHSYVWIQ